MATATKASATTYTMPNDTDIVATRVFDAPRRLVFEAWTNPEHVKQWMFGPDGWSMPICEMDLRPGGAYRMVFRRSGPAPQGAAGRRSVRRHGQARDAALATGMTGGMDISFDRLDTLLAKVA